MLTYVIYETKKLLSTSNKEKYGECMVYLDFSGFFAIIVFIKTKKERWPSWSKAPHC